MPLSSSLKGEYGYELAFKIACEQLARIADMEQQCLRSGARCQVTGSQGVITVNCLNRPYSVTLPDMDICLKDSTAQVPLRDKILILHYIVKAKGTPLSGREIAYKELPEGADYFPTFGKRAIKPVVDCFGTEPELMIAAAEKLGGRRVDYGDVAVTIDAFPRVPVTLVLWRGDAEFSPEGNILFDSTITDYLSTEDINVLCETIVWRLVRDVDYGRS